MILSGLESRMAAIGSSHQQLATVDKQVEQLEQRAASAVAAVTQATGARNALEREIAELHKQVRRLTKAVRAEAKTLAGLKQQANRHPLSRTFHSDADDRSIAQRLGEVRRKHGGRSLVADAQLAVSRWYFLQQSLCWSGSCGVSAELRTTQTRIHLSWQAECSRSRYFRRRR